MIPITVPTDVIFKGSIPSFKAELFPKYAASITPNVKGQRRRFLASDWAALLDEAATRQQTFIIRD